MRRAVLSTLLVVANVLATAPAAHAAIPYTDVPKGHWARPAIRDAAVEHDWLFVEGDSFRPEALLSRRHLARALVRAFAPAASPDETVTFPDLPAEDYWFRFANVAVSLGWLTTGDDGSFEPAGPVTKRVLDRALIDALDVEAAARGLNRIQTEDGVALAVPPAFGQLVLADQLHLHYNHPTGPGEALELYPAQPVTRADAAYALSQAVSAAGSWQISSLTKYEEIVLPSLSEARVQAVEFAFRYAGFPYVYAGEWHRATPDGYCCGLQYHGGFDCSGFTWWVLNEPTAGWDNTHVRPYQGWPLPQRASYQMAEATKTRRAMDELRPLDAVFFDTDGQGTGWRGVDHVGVFLGNGWMIHSSGSRAGVTIDLITEGWWAGAFAWGRRVVPTV